MMEDIQENIDRLVEIVANYVGVNDIGYDALVELQPLFTQLAPDPSLEAFWAERFSKALK